MTALEFLAQIDHIENLSRKNLILLVTYYLRKHKGVLQFSLKDIRKIFNEASIKVPSELKQLTLGLSRGRNSPLMKTSERPIFSLSIHGLNEVESYLTSDKQSSVTIEDYFKTALPYLEKIVSKVQEDNKRRFLSEAIDCLSIRAKRATVIMTWCAMVNHLYDYILANKLSDFNSALSRRPDFYNRIQVSHKDDFSDIKESVFIEVCRSAGVISKDVKKILDEKLGIRNTCAHPSDVEIHDSKVVNFIEDLVDNIITKYKI
jgi:hypothetical protein